MQFAQLAALLGDFHTARVLVLGDVMLDRFVYGSVERISPEAPIPVVNVARVADMPRRRGQRCPQHRDPGRESLPGRRRRRGYLGQ